MITDNLRVGMLQVGTYHATSLLVASRAPPPGVVSRGIGLEGLTSFLAGLWGTGAGASTLTENVHTIAVTKMGSRRAVEFGACVLILVAVVGEDFISYCPQSYVTEGGSFSCGHKSSLDILYRWNSEYGLVRIALGRSFVCMFYLCMLQVK